MNIQEMYHQITICKHIVAKQKANLHASDKLACKPKIYAEHAISAQTKHNRAMATVSINDILDAYNATALLEDPNFREKMRKASAHLNYVL